MEIAIFTFNPFQENTYVLFDETKECIIIDPGCNDREERKSLSDFIKVRGLTPVRLINTHCHIDHVLGNNYISDQYGLGLEMHEGELPVLKQCSVVSDMYGIPYDPSPEPTRFIEEGEDITFGKTMFKTLFTPGHSPASLSFYNEDEKILIAGDVLFRESIGRTDLPGGNFNILIRNIKEKLFVLDNSVQVFPGHGPKTTIGHERVNNPFLQT